MFVTRDKRGDMSNSLVMVKTIVMAKYSGNVLRPMRKRWRNDKKKRFVSEFVENNHEKIIKGKFRMKIQAVVSGRETETTEDGILIR